MELGKLVKFEKYESKKRKPIYTYTLSIFRT